MFTYRKIALCHTAYVTDRAMECQEFRQSIVSKSNFNRKINKLLVRIFQQGWYFYNRKRPNFQKMQKTQYRNFHCIYTLTDVSTKINQRIGLLRRVKAFLSVKDRLTIYNSFILPLFDYADIIWGNKNNSTLMDQLQILQNKAAKTILDAPLLSSSTEALSKLHWHPLTHRRFLHRMVTIFKLKYNLIDCDFDLP